MTTTEAGADGLPHGKYEHIFVVCRFDQGLSDPQHAFAATKAFRDMTAAEVEADRLNALNSGKGSTYFVCTARLVDSAPD